MRYTVYRALADTVMQLDHAAHRQGHSVTPHSFAPGLLPADPSRRQVVQNDLAALDTAIASAYGGLHADTQQLLDAARVQQGAVVRYSYTQSLWNTAVWTDVARRRLVLAELDTLDRAVVAAYRELHADTQQLLAGQDVVRAAYVVRNGVPLETNIFTDEFDGRSRGFWFYRVASRTTAGLESELSPPTPPICSSDVAPPAAPLAQRALTGTGAEAGTIRLQWMASPERDLRRYVIYRTADETAAGDSREMLEVARVAASPVAPPPQGEVLPQIAPGKDGQDGRPLWLEFADVAPPGREWIYRLVAVDTLGNRSLTSVILRGRAIQPPPVPPAWISAARVTSATPSRVLLLWQSPADSRLSCQVERRRPGGPLWTTVSVWLPRGQYSFEDTMGDLDLSWEYRLRVRDQLNQQAVDLPTISLPSV